MKPAESRIPAPWGVNPRPMSPILFAYTENSKAAIMAHSHQSALITALLRNGKPRRWICLHRSLCDLYLPYAVSLIKQHPGSLCGMLPFLKQYTLPISLKLSTAMHNDGMCLKKRPRRNAGHWTYSTNCIMFKVMVPKADSSNIYEWTNFAWPLYLIYWSRPLVT